MIRVDIKPLSVNIAWKGRRYKTPEYKNYEKAVLLMLPKIKMPEPPFKMELVFGFSNRLADIDNPTKMIVDICQKKWKFNDRDIYELNIKKQITKKGKEFFKIKIETIN